MSWQPSPAQHRALQWLMLEGGCVRVADSGRVIANKAQVYPASNSKAFMALAARNCVSVSCRELRITSKGDSFARKVNLKSGGNHYKVAR